MPLVAPLVVSVALASLAASPAAQPAPQLAQLPQGAKVVTLRCTPVPAPEEHAATTPAGWGGSSAMQSATVAQEGTVIDLGPCPPSLVTDEPAPEPDSTTTPTGKPAADDGIGDAERARQEAQRRTQQMLEEMYRRQGGVVGGMTR